LSAAIPRISAIVPAGIFGPCDLVRVFRFHNRRKPFRCHRSTVPGLTMSSASRQLASLLASRTEMPRSAREVWAPDRAAEHDELLTGQEVLGDQSRLATREVTDDTAGGGGRDGLGQARGGGASRLQPSSDDRLHEPQESEHHLPHPSFFDT
jgi:hypothetical protein